MVFLTFLRPFFILKSVNTGSGMGGPSGPPPEVEFKEKASGMARSVIECFHAEYLNLTRQIYFTYSHMCPYQFFPMKFLCVCWLAEIGWWG